MKVPLSESGDVFAIIMLVIALLYAYFGKKIFYATLFLVGGIIGGEIGYLLFSKINWNPLIGAIILFLIFGVIAIVLFDLMIVVIGAIIGFMIGFVLINSLLVAFLLAVILAILSIFLFKLALGVITAIQGAIMAYWALNMLSISSNISLIVGIVIAVSGSLFQIGLFGKGGVEERKKKSKEQFMDEL